MDFVPVNHQSQGSTDQRQTGELFPLYALLCLRVRKVNLYGNPLTVSKCRNADKLSLNLLTNLTDWFLFPRPTLHQCQACHFQKRE